MGDEQLPLEEVEDAFLRIYGRGVHSLTFYRPACLIRKQYLIPDRRPLAGGTMSARSGPGSVRILAHVSEVGDVFSEEGSIIAGALFQGFQITTDIAALEYRVMSEDGTWSDWVPGGEFVGTRGISALLTGSCIRLRPESRAAFKLTAFATFSGSEEAVEALDGEDCCSADGAPLIGLQVVLTPH